MSKKEYENKIKFLNKITVVVTLFFITYITLIFAFALDNSGEPVPSIEPKAIIIPTITPKPSEPISTPILTPTPEPTPFYNLSANERYIVECMVHGEAGNQSHLGKVLVAQCIYNACIKEGLEPSQVRKVYQYAGWSENVDQDTKDAVSEVFDKGKMGTDSNILWFYNPKMGYSSFHESQKFVVKEEDHKFFAPKEG